MYRATDCAVIDSIDRALLTVTGEDATDFLHAMCTNDIKQLKENILLPSALCNADGLVICAFIIWYDGHSYNLLIPLAMVDKVYQWLIQHRLNAKVMIDILQSRRFIGVIGKDANLVLGENLPDKAAVISDLQSQTYILNLGRRYLIVGGTAKVGMYLYEAQHKEALTLPPHYWQWLDVIAGWLSFSEETTNRYTPLELNLDLFGAIAFKTACYPGREAIKQARLSENKKRALLYQSNDLTLLPTGTPVYFADQPVGEVIITKLSPKDIRHTLVLVPIDDKAIDLNQLTTEHGKLGSYLELPHSLDDLRGVKK